MTTRTRITAGIATGLIAAVLVPAAAIGYTDTGTPTAGGGSDSTFVPKLPRSADAAVPFVADVSPELNQAQASQQPAAIGDDGFQLGRRSDRRRGRPRRDRRRARRLGRDRDPASALPGGTARSRAAGRLNVHLARGGPGGRPAAPPGFAGVG